MHLEAQNSGLFEVALKYYRNQSSNHANPLKKLTYFCVKDWITHQLIVVG